MEFQQRRFFRQALSHLLPEQSPRSFCWLDGNFKVEKRNIFGFAHLTLSTSTGEETDDAVYRTLRLQQIFGIQETVRISFSSYQLIRR